ncbi:glycosyltransferase family protein [Craterilacuibacter sinensis]|uniref:Glycosyl transferase family 1 domain-containing protein n=1 Tax=Craterilacuibacter sinensis TaxID=2686017 RepID=A0A845BU16_9NEIS|nr:glycosyltransferase family 4 protein [Craterilacuibacter sinensis]MXR37656.1 hypothetical protein [Craterilacuibacter sinensis]
MKLVEKAAFARISLAICVTKKMEYFYRKKYITTRAEFMYLPIFTTQVCQQANQDEVNAIRSSLNIPEDAIVFIYAGGLQAWQQVAKMIHATKRLMNYENHYFIFLTAETKSLSEKFQNTSGVIPKNVIITHAKPENLRNYYALANFGFILRHDHILNKVANPTKMVEYLYFGIYPVVLTADIGDFLEMGYEYISLDKLNRTSTPPKKSEINHRISLKLLEDTNSQNIAKLLSTVIS